MFSVPPAFYWPYYGCNKHSTLILKPVRLWGNAFLFVGKNVCICKYFSNTCTFVISNTHNCRLIRLHSSPTHLPTLLSSWCSTWKHRPYTRTTWRSAGPCGRGQTPPCSLFGPPSHTGSNTTPCHLQTGQRVIKWTLSIKVTQGAGQRWPK